MPSKLSGKNKGLNLLHRFEYWCNRIPNELFLIEKDVQELTYSQTKANSEKAATWLYNTIGVSSGDKVAIVSSSNVELICLMIGCWYVGAIPVPLNIKLDKNIIKQILETLKINHKIVDSQNLDLYSDLGFQLYKLSNKCELSLPNVSNELAAVLFTSGSSGVPKGVPISHEAIFNNTSRTAERIYASQKDRVFINSPAYTTSSIVHVFTMMQVGASVTIQHGTLLGPDFVKAIIDSNCTGFGGVPVHFIRLASTEDVLSKLSNLRFMINSGDHLPISILQKINARLDQVKIFCMYGLTEVAGRLCILEFNKNLNKPGSVGKPLDGMEVTIRNEKGEKVANEQMGEVYVQGDLLMSGYINAQSINEVELTSHGFKTGDLGYFDSEGYLFLVGRKDDVVKIGGEKISIKQIEDRLFSNPFFKQFIVLVEDNKHFGKIIVLKYIPLSGAKFNKSEFLKFAKSVLPEAQIPVKYSEVENLDYTASGKVIRNK